MGKTNKQKNTKLYQRKGVTAEQAPSWLYPVSNKMMTCFSDSTE